MKILSEFFLTVSFSFIFSQKTASQVRFVCLHPLKADEGQAGFVKNIMIMTHHTTLKDPPSNRFKRYCINHSIMKMGHSHLTTKSSTIFSANMYRLDYILVHVIVDVIYLHTIKNIIA